MSKIVLERDGLYEHKYSPKTKSDAARKVKQAHVLAKLRLPCEIADGVTLGDLFWVVGRYKLLRAFLAEYSWCWRLGEFHEQAKEPDLTPEPDPDPLDYLEVYWTADYHSDRTIRKGEIKEGWFDVGTGFHGIGRALATGWHAEQGYEPGQVIAYSVSMTPMYKLAPLPVKLNETIEIYDNNWIYQTPKGGGPPERPPPVIRSRRSFTLLEALDAIYDDISFYGGPAESAAKRDELAEMVEAIKQGRHTGG